LRFDASERYSGHEHDEAVAEAERLRREHPQRRQERQAEPRAGPQVTPDPTESQTPPVHGQRGF
jgi:hypothetical protein